MVSYRYDYGDGNLPGVDAAATKSYGGGVLTVNLPYSYEKRVWYEGQANEGWRYRYIRSRADVYAYYSS